MTTLQPNRLKGFARYFKDYMGAWSIVVAAMPVPVTAFKLIPVYRAYRLPLSVYTPLFCFLLLGFIFFMRHQLAPLMFRRESRGTIGAGYFSFIPIGLILISFTAIILYHITLRESVTKLTGVDRKASAEGVLEETALQVIPDGTTLMLFYLTFFLAAEGAFILMATKEYLQDEIGISDSDLYSFVLKPRENLCYVTFRCALRVGEVLVNGKYVGSTNCSAQLAEGEHTIRVKASGCKTWRQSLSIRPIDRELTVWADLESAPLGYVEPEDGQ